MAIDPTVAAERVIDPPPDALTHRAEANMRTLVLIFRVLGWVWMTLLVAVTLATDDMANPAVAGAAVALATAWTVVTWWASRHRSIMGALWFTIADGVVCLLMASASYIADAGDLFHGGYPISWIAVAAYGGGLRWALPASLILMVQQAILLLQSGRSAVAAVGSIVFVVYAFILGYLISMIRQSDLERRLTEARLTAEREENARRIERLELANRLHDSALQTLQVIDSSADDADRVRSLARKQSRELRSLIDDYAVDGVSVRSELELIAGEIEALYGVEVSLVVRADSPVDPTVRAVLDASREAMTNAAKHAGVDRVDAYAVVEDEALTVRVRDEGSGFDPDAAPHGHGIEYSIRRRVDAVGGTTAIASTPGRGTEVSIAAPMGQHS